MGGLTTAHETRRLRPNRSSTNPRTGPSTTPRTAYRVASEPCANRPSIAPCLPKSGPSMPKSSSRPTKGSSLGRLNTRPVARHRATGLPTTTLPGQNNPSTARTCNALAVVRGPSSPRSFGQNNASTCCQNYEVINTRQQRGSIPRKQTSLRPPLKLDLSLERLVIPFLLFGWRSVARPASRPGPQTFQVLLHGS